MAQFRATIKGNRGEASRLGTASSGVLAKINGWNGGVAVVAKHSTQHRHVPQLEDRFDIYATGGSNGGKPSVFIGYVDGWGVFHAAD